MGIGFPMSECMEARWRDRWRPEARSSGGDPEPGRDVLDAERKTADVNHIGDLAKYIRLGEDSTLELERIVLAGCRVTSPSRNDFADELAALANARGGTVVLGADDKTREIQGIPLDCLDMVEAWAREICNDSAKPALDADLYKVELEDADGRPVPVIRMEIPRSLFVHRSPGGCFRRLGSSKREMAPEILARLFQERSQSRLIRFDESVAPNSTPSDLDCALTRRFLREDITDEGVTEEAARKLRVVADDEHGAPRLTLAGALLCTREPQRWLPHAYVQAVSYAGERTDVDYPVDARDIEGPLDEQVAEALHFVRRNMLIRATKTTARAGRPQFSQRAVFEALVNAVAHRDYSMAGARVRLCTCSRIGSSSTFPARWRTRSHRTACTCGSPAGTSRSCRSSRVVLHRQALAV